MTNISKQDVINVTIQYINNLKAYKQLVQEHGLITTTEILEAYKKVEESHKRYIEVTRSYIQKPK